MDFLCDLVEIFWRIGGERIHRKIASRWDGMAAGSFLTHTVMLDILRDNFSE